MTQQNAIQKIRKLFALSNSSNLHEAQSALLQAQKMMAQYNIVTVEMDENETFEHIQESCKGDPAKPYVRNLAAIIAENFRCKHFYRGKTIVFFGRPDDVSIAAESFRYALRFINRESRKIYKDVKERTGSGKGVVNSYAFGCLIGIKKTLDQQATALMIVTPQDVTDAFDEMAQKWKKRNSYRVAYATNEYFIKGYHDGSVLFDK